MWFSGFHRCAPRRVDGTAFYVMFTTETSVLVAMVDDQEMVREGMAMLINATPDMRVVAHAADSESVIRLAGNRVPRVLLIEANLAGHDAFAAMQTIRKRWPGVGRILMAHRLSDELIERALRAQVEGIVDKHDVFEAAARTILAVASGRRFFPRAVSERLAAGAVSSNSRVGPPWKLPSLTRREHQIIHYLVDGSTVKQIARRLDLSASTIDKHKSNLMRKLGVHSTVQLTRYAIREGFVSP